MVTNNTHLRESLYAQWIIRRRWLVLAICILLALSAASGMRFLGFSTDYRVFFSEENPRLTAFEELQNTYTKLDNIFLVMESETDDVFTPRMLDAVEALTEAAWKLPFTIRVDSLSNFQHTYAEGDDLIVEDLVTGGADYTEQQRDKVRKIALADPLLNSRLVSADATVTALNVTMHMPEKALDEVPTAVAAARALTAQIEEQYPFVKVRMTGWVTLNNAFMEASMQDMSTLVPMMYLAIAVFSVLLLRSFAAAGGILIVVLLSILTAMGLAGWMGVKLTPPSSSAPTIIMTLAVADSVHILISMLVAMLAGLNRNEAINESMRLNLQPVFLTSATTAVGFLSLNFSDSPPFHDMGNIAAMGVMAAFFYSVTLLPAFLSVVPLKAQTGIDAYSGLMDKLAASIIERRRILLYGGMLVSLVVFAMIPQNEFNDQWLEYFEEDTAFRADSEFVNQRISGVYQIQYSLDSGEPNAIAEPRFLADSQRFVDWLRAHPDVAHVNTINDTMKRLNKNMHADDPAWYRLPEERELAAQYLLLYQMSLPFGLDLNNQISIDFSKTQIIVTLKDMDTTELRTFAEASERWMKENIPSIATIGSGPTIMFAYIVDRNIKGMFQGTLIALVIISGLILLALKSLRIGLISLLPNLLPAGLAFGIWGLFVGQVNLAVTMVVGMTIGIVVDDTVHFLSKYMRGRRERGLAPVAAVRYAFSSVGIALVLTSLILVGGFAVLAQSSFAMNSGMAQLTMITVVVALIADFILLPPLLLLLEKKGVEKERMESADDIIPSTSDP